VAGVLAGIALSAGLEKAGSQGVLAPLVLLACVVLLRFPEACLGLLLFGTAMAEVEPVGALPSGARFYDQVFSSFTTPDMLIFFGLAGVLLRFVAQDLRPRLPDPLTAPLVVLGLAVMAGVATAYSTGSVSPPELFHRAMQIGHLILIPLLAVNVIRDTRALKVFAFGLAVLACLKGVTGLYASLGGFGGGVEEEVASFLNPFPNLLMLTFGLGVIAALVRRVELPAWMYGGLPIALLALLLSYRRSFWIAAILTIVFVVIIASRRRGRAVLAIAAVSLALAFVAANSIAGPSDSTSASPLAERAQTLAPGAAGNRGDRYRNDERHNVIENIEQHPVTGVGLGVNWEVHQPLAEAHDRRYVHFAFLWYWLAFGILGAIAYLLLFLSSLWTSTQVWRHHPDQIVQVCAIAVFGGIVGLAVVELTATFAGIEPRLTILLGALLGWLAAAWQDLPARRATANH
jgi:hypothetical protein